MAIEIIPVKDQGFDRFGVNLTGVKEIDRPWPLQKGVNEGVIAIHARCEDAERFAASFHVGEVVEVGAGGRRFQTTEIVWKDADGALWHGNAWFGAHVVVGDKIATHQHLDYLAQSGV